MSKQPKAVALLSGGLDSMLAVRVVQEQGVYVEGINFFTGFCVEGHTHAIRQHSKNKAKRNQALWTAEQLGIKLHIIDIVEEYKDVLLNPKHGYGSNLNPCLDCKIFMVGKAKQWLEQHQFDFIITGEVMGQRPNSQLKHKLPIVAKESGADDLLLRPLSAKNLPETLAEKKGWVKREELCDFTGRSRKPQMALAEKFGFDEYAQPAGGCCFLTDAKYSAKLQDLWTHRGNRKYDLDDLIRLKVGRHLRPADNYKLIIGREEGENNFMDGYRKEFIHLRVADWDGPLTLVEGEPTEADIQQAAAITARFSQGRKASKITVEVYYPDENQGCSASEMKPQLIQVKPLKDVEIEKSWYI